MDYNSDLTTNGFILEFLVGIFFFLDFISASTKFCMIAQMCFFSMRSNFFDD